jgi:hypothetical protein
MGANDAAEMLEVAKAECVRLERKLAAVQRERDEYAAALLKVDVHIEQILEMYEAEDRPAPEVVAFDLHQFMVVPGPTLAAHDAELTEKVLDRAALAVRGLSAEYRTAGIGVPGFSVEAQARIRSLASLDSLTTKKGQ